MKLLTLASILASVSLVFAQTNTGTNAAPSAQNTPAATAVTTAKKTVKKTVKKNKKNKKVTKTSELKGSSTVTTSETAQTPQVETTKTTTTTITETTTPAAGTSVATTSGSQNKAKIWSAAASVYGTAFSENTKDVSVLTTVGGDIQVVPNLKVFAYQTFETLATTKYSETKNDNFKPAFYDAGITTQVGSIFGSNDSILNLRYRNISGDAYISKIGDWSNIHGFIQAEHSIPYNLTPAIGLSIDSHIRHSFMKDTTNKNRIGVIPQVKYSFNDTFSVYQRAGYILSLRDNNEMRRDFERAVLATGISINAFSGFNIDMNVNQDKAIYAAPGTGVAVTDFNVYDAPVPAAGSLDEVKYDASVTYSF